MAFENLKAVLGMKPIVKIFDPRTELVVTTDTSEQSISGILAQDGHPIMLSWENCQKPK